MDLSWIATGNGSIARWCSGSTAAFGAGDPGSNPGRAASINPRESSFGAICVVEEAGEVNEIHFGRIKE